LISLQRYGLFQTYDGQGMKWYWTNYEVHAEYVLFMNCTVFSMKNEETV